MSPQINIEGFVNVVEGCDKQGVLDHQQGARGGVALQEGMGKGGDFS